MELRKFIATTIKEYLNEQQTLNEELTVYHCSPSKFSKFTTSKMGSGNGKQLSGWGIYLSDNKESVNSYGKYLYQTTLFKGKDSEQYILIDLGKPVKKDIVSKVVKSIYKYYNKDFDIDKFNLYYNYSKDKPLSKVDFNDYELVEFDYSGYLFYKTLSRLLGDDKRASLFLLNNGIYGLKRTISNTTTDYILFDGNAITIEKIIEI